MAEITIEQKKKNLKQTAILFGVTIGVFTFLFVAKGYTMVYLTGCDLITGIITGLKEGIFFIPRGLQWLKAIPIGILAGGIGYIFMDADNTRRFTYKNEESGGDASFMTEKEIKDYNNKYIARTYLPGNTQKDNEIAKDCTIMSRSFSRPNKLNGLIGNNNVCIIGGSGMGKSYSYVGPAIMQMSSSMVIVDPAGDLCADYGKMLAENGYKVKIFNVNDLVHSNRYNPFEYVGYVNPEDPDGEDNLDAGIDALIHTFIANTQDGSDGDRFFTDAEKMLYSACIHYLIDYCEDQSKKNFTSIVKMILGMKRDSENPTKQSPTDRLFASLPSESVARIHYESAKMANERTLSSMIISCLVRLQPFVTPQISELIKYDELELDKLGMEKTALFLIIPQQDNPYHFLVSMLFVQLFNTLFAVGNDRAKRGLGTALPVRVHVIADEFANVGIIPGFVRTNSTNRKYNVSIDVALQDSAQLEKMYEEDWRTIMSNCSSILFLGTNDNEMLKAFSDKLGNTTIRTRSESINNGKGGSSQSYQYSSIPLMAPNQLGKMDPYECIVFTQSMKPVRDKKANRKDHPNYPKTGCDNIENKFPYIKMAAYDLTRNDTYDLLMKAQEKARKYREYKEWEESRVHKPTARAACDPVAEAEKFTADDKAKEMRYQEVFSQAMIAASECIAPPIIIDIPNVDQGMLFRLLQDVYGMLGKAPVFLISEQEALSGANALILGIDPDETEVMEEKMQHSCITQIKRYSRFVAARMKGKDKKEYLKELRKKYQKL